MKVKWKERLNALPLVLPGAVPDLRTALTQRIDGVQLTACHLYVGACGPMHVLSIQGTQGQRQRAMIKLVGELGQPYRCSDNKYDLTTAYWRSDTAELPSTIVHQLLGDERIARLCSFHGLEDNEQRLIHRVLAVSNDLLDATEPMAVLVEKYFDNLSPDRRGLVEETIQLILADYKEKRTTVKLSHN